MTPWVVSLAGIAASILLLAFVFHLIRSRRLRERYALLWLLTGLVLRSATLPVEYLLNMTGHHRDTMRVYAFAALANLVLNLLLIPAFGILGAANRQPTRRC